MQSKNLSRSEVKNLFTLTPQLESNRGGTPSRFTTNKPGFFRPSPGFEHTTLHWFWYNVKIYGLHICRRLQRNLNKGSFLRLNEDLYLCFFFMRGIIRDGERKWMLDMNIILYLHSPPPNNHPQMLVLAIHECNWPIEMGNNPYKLIKRQSCLCSMYGYWIWPLALPFALEMVRAQVLLQSQ